MDVANLSAAELLQAVTETSRFLVLGILAVDPNGATRLHEILQEGASNMALEPATRLILADLATTVGLIAAARARKQ